MYMYIHHPVVLKIKFKLWSSPKIMILVARGCTTPFKNSSSSFTENPHIFPSYGDFQNQGSLMKNYPSKNHRIRVLSSQNHIL